jgi:taurine dioxygenase
VAKGSAGREYQSGLGRGDEMAYQHIEVHPIAGSLGAELSKADLSKPLSGEVFQEIHRALMDHLVIFFRDQNLTPDQHKAFSRRFGELLEVPFIRALKDHPEILPVMKGASEKVKRNFGGVWHTDMSYTPEPPMGSALYGRVIPPYGGDTMWANMYRAYDTLSDGMKQLLDGMVVVHSAVKSYGANGAVVNNGDPAHKMAVTTDTRANQEIEHPAVRVHPVTRKKALYVNSTYSMRFKGFSEEESAPLLQYLYAHATRPEFTCRFKWTKGSLALWDNRCTQHLAMNDYDGFDRELHRTTIAGDRPIPVSA